MADPEKGFIQKACEVCSGTGKVVRITTSYRELVEVELLCPKCGGDGEYKWGRIVDI